LIAVAAGVVWVYVQMECDDVLSRVAKTPNRVSLNATFLTHIVAIMIPLAGAVLTQFPSISDSLNQFLEPILRVLK
jgi:hypothetical protein